MSRNKHDSEDSFETYIKQRELARGLLSGRIKDEAILASNQNTFFNSLEQFLSPLPKGPSQKQLNTSIAKRDMARGWKNKPFK